MSDPTPMDPKELTMTILLCFVILTVAGLAYVAAWSWFRSRGKGK